MNLILSNHLSFNQVDDPIRTEETIFHQLKSIDLGLPLVGLPIAYSINKFGVNTTQSFIDEIEKKEKTKKVYVCQHILVSNLNFGENIVFTPHTVENDQYNFIPHYNPVFSKRKDFLLHSMRRHDFSFMGDFNTNNIRSEIGKDLSNICPVFQTGKWFFSHDHVTQINLKERYSNLLEDTKFPLCPQGTGPSTLRLFETFSSGGFPVIFNDLKLPKDLKKFCLKSNISSIKSKQILENISNFSNESQLEMLEIYWTKYSNDNLSKSIIENMRAR